MNELKWTCVSFQDLSVSELYLILQLRSEVFVIEQNCVYPDMDNKDLLSFHLCGWLNQQPVAYARLLPAGLAFEEASIGRVCTSPSYRNNGAGRTLMIKAIDITQNKFACTEIRIGAQLYLEKFYTSLGFTQSSPEYLEDGIRHIEMLYSK